MPASANQRKAKFYSITKTDRKQLARKAESWERMSDLIGRVGSWQHAVQPEYSRGRLGVGTSRRRGLRPPSRNYTVRSAARRPTDRGEREQCPSSCEHGGGLPAGDERHGFCAATEGRFAVQEFAGDTRQSAGSTVRGSMDPGCSFVVADRGRGLLLPRETGDED